jgi:hypothetical protein
MVPLTCIKVNQAGKSAQQPRVLLGLPQWAALMCFLTFFGIETPFEIIKPSIDLILLIKVTVFRMIDCVHKIHYLK